AVDKVDAALWHSAIVDQQSSRPALMRFQVAVAVKHRVQDDDRPLLASPGGEVKNAVADGGGAVDKHLSAIDEVIEGLGGAGDSLALLHVIARERNALGVEVHVNALRSVDHGDIAHPTVGSGVDLHPDRVRVVEPHTHRRRDDAKVFDPHFFHLSGYCNGLYIEVFCAEKLRIVGVHQRNLEGHGMAVDGSHNAACRKNSINPLFLAVRSLQAAHAHIFDPRSGHRLRYLYQIAGMDVRCIRDMDGMRAEGNVGVGDVGGGGDGTQRKVAFDDDAGVRVSG